MRSTGPSSPGAAWPWRRSLFLRMFLSMQGAVWLAMTVVVVLMVVAFRVPGIFPGELPVRLTGFAARMLDDAPATPAGLTGATADLARRLGLDLLVVALDGRVLAVTSRPPTLRVPRDFRDAAGAPVILEGPDFRRGHVWIAGAPVTLAGPTRAVVIARMGHVSPLHRPVRSYLVFTLAVVVTLAISLRVARKVTAPLHRLTRVAERFGEGDLRARSGLDRADEIGRLARSFDAMADRIEALRRAERELLATISHELRTPLARMRVTLGLVEPGDEATRRRIADADEELEGLQRLVADLLIQGRLDAGALTLQRTWIQAKELVHKSVDRLRRLWPDRVVDLDVDEDLFVHVDEALVHRVLDNLLENACKYDPAGGPVTVHGHERGEAVVLAVRDRGPGIPPDELAGLFLPFARGRRAASRADGTGLGLALSRRLIEAHGGTLDLTSAPGEGTLVEVVLPRARASG